MDKIGDAQVYFAVYEKYYVRNNSMACLTVQITSHDGVQLATVIGTAGGEGFLNISWGANEDLAAGCVRTLKRLGFSE